MTFLRSLLFNVAFYLATVAHPRSSAPPASSSRRSAARSRSCASGAGSASPAARHRRHALRGPRTRQHSHRRTPGRGQAPVDVRDLRAPAARCPTRPSCIKRELRSIPLFGQYTVVTGMIHVDRDKGTTALRALAARGREELAKEPPDRHLPGGDAPAAGRPARLPDRHRASLPGARTFRSCRSRSIPVSTGRGGSSCAIPARSSSSSCRRSRPGSARKAFLERLETTIEHASDRLLVEASTARPRPPFPAEAAARLAIAQSAMSGAYAERAHRNLPRGRGEPVEDGIA